VTPEALHAGEDGRSRQTFRYDDGVSISYEVAGNGPTPVVFVHGFAAGIFTWHDLRPFFPPDRFRLYLLDLKGYGFSSKPHDGRYGPEDHAAIVAAFLEKLGLRRAVLVGHSLGGGIALTVCLTALRAGKRDMIGRLVLIDCAAYPQPLPPLMRLLRLPILGWILLHVFPRRFMVCFTLTRIFRNKEAVTRERIARYASAHAQSGAAYVFIKTCRQLAGFGRMGFASRYGAIAVPTLIVWGKEDPLIDIRLGERLHAEIPGSRLVVIAGCGHNPHEERPAETFAAIGGFLDTAVNGPTESVAETGSHPYG
jgi:pimeloyl-ACP methyl ester carboxylesterase